MSQLLLPDGASSSRITDIMSGPAGKTQPAQERESAQVEVKDLRELEFIEAAAIIESEEEKRYQPKVDVNAVQTMRVRHHQIARLLAMGHKPAEIARVMSCAPATIANLERSPAFQALLLEYMNMLDKNAVETVTRMQVLRNLTVDELTERMAQPAKAQSIKASELVEIMKATSDRTGLGPSSTTKTILNGALSVADIRAIKTMAPAGTARIIDVLPDRADAGLRLNPYRQEEKSWNEPGPEDGACLRAPDREVDQTGDLITDIVSSVVGIHR
jgi:hypothetical protein